MLPLGACQWLRFRCTADFTYVVIIYYCYYYIILLLHNKICLYFGILNIKQTKRKKSVNTGCCQTLYDVDNKKSNYTTVHVCTWPCTAKAGSSSWRQKKLVTSCLNTAQLNIHNIRQGICLLQSFMMTSQKIHTLGPNQIPWLCPEFSRYSNIDNILFTYHKLAKMSVLYLRKIQ